MKELSNIDQYQSQEIQQAFPDGISEQIISKSAKRIREVLNRLLGIGSLMLLGACASPDAQRIQNPDQTETEHSQRNTIEIRTMYLNTKHYEIPETVSDRDKRIFQEKIQRLTLTGEAPEKINVLNPHLLSFEIEGKHYVLTPYSLLTTDISEQEWLEKRDQLQQAQKRSFEFYDRILEQYRTNETKLYDSQDPEQQDITYAYISNKREGMGIPEIIQDIKEIYGREIPAESIPEYERALENDNREMYLSARRVGQESSEVIERLQKEYRVEIVPEKIPEYEKTLEEEKKKQQEYELMIEYYNIRKTSENSADAIRKFTEKYNDELVERIVPDEMREKLEQALELEIQAKELTQQLALREEDTGFRIEENAAPFAGRLFKVWEYEKPFPTDEELVERIAFDYYNPSNDELIKSIFITGHLDQIVLFKDGKIDICIDNMDFQFCCDQPMNTNIKIPTETGWEVMRFDNGRFVEKLTFGN